MNLFYILAIVCFVLNAFGIGGKVNLFPLGWAFVIAGLTFGPVFVR